MSVRQNVRSAKRPSAKCPFGKMSFGKMSFGKVSFGKMSGHHASSSLKAIFHCGRFVRAGGATNFNHA
jgi:hypothetical protein